jgi:hypothetical protein
MKSWKRNCTEGEAELISGKISNFLLLLINEYFSAWAYDKGWP